MNEFTFEDSRPPQELRHTELPRLFRAIHKLNEAAANGKIEVLALTHRKSAPRELPTIISYLVTDSDRHYYRDVVTTAKFTVSHYVGTYSTIVDNQPVTIKIKPRWGATILGYLLQFTSGIYMPPDAASGLDTSKHSADWLMVLLWKSSFNQALRRFHIPKEYRVVRTNDRFFRGRLDVQRQIRDNIADQSRFACINAPLTMDTAINQTIRYVVRLLSTKQSGFAGLMRDMAGYDEKLASLGVQSREVTPAQIDSIRYTRMSNGYKDLMLTSKAVILKFGAGNSERLRNDTSFFIDIAEIWENYIQAILTKHLPTEYRVFNPNESGGEWLLAGEKREIRPDLLIERKSQIVAILDAKYKIYTKIGTYEPGRVSREDLYQMTTYLYHYGKRGVPLLGLFISPGGGKVALESMAAEPNHRIGVLNLDISRWDHSNGQADSFKLEEIQKMEEEFAKSVLDLLPQDEDS